MIDLKRPVKTDFAGYFRVPIDEFYELSKKGGTAVYLYSSNVLHLGKIPVYYSERKILILKWQVGEISGANHYLCGFPPFSLDWYVGLMKKHALDTDEIV